jgi:DNA-binding NtrC family response regulator
MEPGSMEQKRHTSANKVVLVVEDEALLLMMAGEIVEDAGLEPVLAHNADEAIVILESRDDIRIVFTDVRMPGSMDGIRLAAAVRHRWPAIRLVVVSGHVTGESELPPGTHFFRKPYVAEKIIATLHELGAGTA